MTKKVLVCGGREFIDYEQLNSELNRLVGRTVPTIIQGGASGADFLSKVYARRYGLECHQYSADWKSFGRAAGMIRNKRMLEEGEPDIVIAFEGGRGTANMMELAVRAGVEVVGVLPSTDSNTFTLIQK